MKPSHPISLLRLTLVLCTLCASSANSQPYHLTDLGTLGGTTSSANAINATGQIVGESTLSNDTAAHAFLFSAGHMTDLGTLGGNSAATAINATGDIVGNYISGYDGFFGTLYTGFRYSNGNMNSLGLAGANGINATGQIAGARWTGDLFGNRSQHAVLYTPPSTVRDLDPQSGPNFSFATAINDRGQVVGNSNYQGGAFLWTPTTPGGTTGAIKNLAVGGDATAYAINDQGQIAGATSPGGDAFLWTPTTPNGATGSYITLPTLGGTQTHARAINAASQVVGSSNLPHDTEEHAFLYKSGTTKDLNTLLDASGDSWTLTQATGINDMGQITGTGIITIGTGNNTTTQTRAFLLTPDRPGDANGDGQVDFADLVIVAQHYGAIGNQTWSKGDFNNDQSVNFADLVMLAQNYNVSPPATASFQMPASTSNVPEPACLGLLSAIIALKRRPRARKLIASRHFRR